MAEATYRLEKVRIGDSYYHLRVSVDAEGICVDYGGKDMPLPEALDDIQNRIAEIKKADGLDIATDKEINEMLDEVFGPRE